MRCRSSRKRSTGSRSTSSKSSRAHENALPLIMTHGWPGSVIELLDTIGLLIDLTTHGGTPEDAFHLVLPSCLATASRASRPSSAGSPPAPHARGRS